MAPNVTLSFGPMLIGVFINLVLFGVLIVQFYTYYQTFKSDSKWLKYFVLYLFLMETANSLLDVLMMYQPLIVQYGLPEATKFFPTLFVTEPAVIVAVSTPIQLFFAWRIKLLTKSSLLAGIVVFFSIVSFAGGMWTSVMVGIVKVFARKPELHWPALLWFLASVVADVMITVVLVMNLSKRKTGFVATDDAISKIIRMTVQTGMLTAFFAIGDVIFFMTLPHTALNFIWDLSLSKLYANCLLSTLNARVELNELAGVGSGVRQRAMIASSASRKPETFLESHGHRTGVYELDAHKTFDGTSTYPPRDSDMEYGIQVTKVVERLEDPPTTQ